MNRWIVLLLASLTACDTGGDEGTEAPGEGSAEEQVSDLLGGSVPLDTTAAVALSSAFRAAAQRALPAVVFVAVEQRVPTGDAIPIPESFRRFFGIPPEGFEMPPQRGSGSGFIIDEEGHIITNHHVVANATRVLVRLLDSREYDAEVIGADPSTDIAVLRISPGSGERLPAITLGRSEQLRVGDWVLALGNPLGLDFTVTAGIVSAMGRQLTGEATALQSFIQTDAAINPGNSGGPLIDLLGRVVGINTAIASPTGTYAGYGFAVPIDLARRVTDDLLRYGHVRRPRLGVSLSDVTAVDAEVYRLPEVAGAEVVAVEEGSPGAQAGLRVGDVIVALDGRPIRDGGALTAALAQRQPGDRVTLALIRNGRRQTVTVRLGEFPRVAAETRPTTAREQPDRLLGFQVQPLTPDIAVQLGFNQRSGVVIANVDPYSPAASAGMRPGQLLLSINGQAVSNVASVTRSAASIRPGSAVSVRVRDPEFGETILNFRAGR